jgi:hypothetical protein
MVSVIRTLVIGATGNIGRHVVLHMAVQNRLLAPHSEWQQIIARLWLFWGLGDLLWADAHEKIAALHNRTEIDGVKLA